MRDVFSLNHDARVQLQQLRLRRHYCLHSHFAVVSKEVIMFQLSKNVGGLFSNGCILRLNFVLIVKTLMLIWNYAVCFQIMVAVNALSI